jgi:DNA-directed RNA polymerase alpha subunit
MSELKKTLRICNSGHEYYKSSDCPTCPVCEKAKALKNGLLSKLSAPARRALENNRIITIKQLSDYTESEILNLHGIGPSSIPILKNELKVKGLSFRKNK